MTKLRITTVVGSGGSAWFPTDEAVKEFFAGNGLQERSNLGISGVTAEPRAKEEFFLFIKPGEAGALQRKFRLVRSDGWQGTVVDGGVITDVFPVCRTGSARHHMYEGMHGRLHRWVFLGELVEMSGNGMDFRFYMGTELD